MDTYILWSIAVLLIAFSACFVVAQTIGMVLAIRRMRADENASGYSLIPLLGGIVGAVGFRVAPSPALQDLWWLPLILDPGCALLFSMMAAYLLWNSLRSHWAGRSDK